MAKGAEQSVMGVKYWEIIADNLSTAGWSWGCVSTVDSRGRPIFIADAHRGEDHRFIVRADEKLTAFSELESASRAQKRTDSHFSCQLIVNGFGTRRASALDSKISQYMGRAVPFSHAECAVDSKQRGFARASRFP